MRTISTGLHIVPKRLKSGETRYYCYAYRGGPCIHVQDGTPPAINQQLLDLAYAERRHKGPADALDRIIDLYCESPAFTTKADSTRADYRQWLNRISERFGKVPARMVPDLRAEILAWRDEIADTPRAADRMVGMLSTLFGWAMERNLIAYNPARDIKALHKADRSNLIWEPRHWEAVKSVPAHVHRALTLASLTGLRQGDLLSLTWEQVGRHDIETTAHKTGGRVVVPLYPELKRALGKKGEGAILRTSAGNPWTVSGFKSSWQKSRPKGFDRTFHDLRGTFVTNLAMRGMTDPEIAYITGWETARIAAIRARYVDRARVAKGLAKKLGGR